MRFHATAVLAALGPILSGAAFTQDIGATSPETSSSTLHEVVVKAQRRSQSEQDVPVALAALTGVQLQKTGVQDITQLGNVIPGLNVGNETGFAIVHLRGVGTTAIAPGFENPVATYVDGVYYASTSSTLFDMTDIESVEVDKGPQGTLYGRNATGGLIQVTTRSPAQTPVLDMDVGYGNYQSALGDVYASGGITDDSAANFSAHVSGAGQGYGVNAFNGKEVDRNDLTAAMRSKLAWDPREGTHVLAEVDYSRERNSDTAGRLIPGATNLPILSAEPPPTGSPWDIDQNVQPLFDNRNGGVSLRLDQELQWASVRDIVAYRQAATDIDFDLDFTPEPYEAGLLHTAEDQFSEELDLMSKAGGRLHWSAGVYYFQGGAKYDPSHVPFDPDPAFTLIPGFSGLSVIGTQRAESVAGYGQVTGTVAPGLNLTVGARYTYEKHMLYGDEPGFLVGGGMIDLVPYTNKSKAFDKPTYHAAIDYHATRDVMLYVSYSTGFKSGGFNTQSLTDPAFLPETLDAYEAGFKTELLSHRLRMNAAGFHYEYKDIQVQRLELASTGIINGAAATINGADLDFAAAATNQLTLRGSAEYLSATYDSFPDAPLSNPDLAVTEPVSSGSAEGRNLPFSPRMAYTAGGDYRVPVGRSALDIGVTVIYSGRYFFEPDNVIEQHTFTKVNAIMDWTSPEGHWGVTLWGDNLTNVASLAFATTLTNGLHWGQFSPPRIYGVTFKHYSE